MKKKIVGFLQQKFFYLYFFFTVEERESVSICKTTHFPHKADRLYFVVFYET